VKLRSKMLLVGVRDPRPDGLRRTHRRHLRHERYRDGPCGTAVGGSSAPTPPDMPPTDLSGPSAK
jgi:hypothetical protein